MFEFSSSDERQTRHHCFLKIKDVKFVNQIHYLNEYFTSFPSSKSLILGAKHCELFMPYFPFPSRFFWIMHTSIHTCPLEQSSWIIYLLNNMNYWRVKKSAYNSEMNFWAVIHSKWFVWEIWILIGFLIPLAWLFFVGHTLWVGLSSSITLNNKHGHA